MCAGEKSQLVWFSKSGSYEKPYCVKGAIQPAGSKQKPKGICKDRIIGTRKGIGLFNRKVSRRRTISCCTGAEKQRSNL